MNNEVEVLIATSLSLLVMLIWRYSLHTHFKTSLYAIGLYTFSSIMGIVFYFQPLSLLSGHIQWWPMFYWITLFGITLIPLYQFDKSYITDFKYNDDLFAKIALFGFIISIEPFFEQLILSHGLVTGGDLGETMVEMHDEGSLDNMSFIGRNMLRLNIALYDLSFIILFIEFLKSEKNRKVLFYLSFIILTRNLTGIMAGHRSAAIEVVMKLLLIVIIVFPLVSEVERKKIRNFVFIVFAFVGTVFAIITIGRQMLYSVTKGDDFTLLYFLSWYAGEGLVNFNQWLPEMRETTGGEYTCWTWLSIFGANPHEIDYDYMYGPLQKLQGIPQNIFYTYIGNFVQDFGFFGGAIYLIIQTVIFKSLTNERSNIMPVSKLYIFVFYASIILQGVTSYAYNGGHGKFFIWSFLIYFYLRYKKI